MAESSSRCGFRVGSIQWAASVSDKTKGIRSWIKEMEAPGSRVRITKWG